MELCIEIAMDLGMRLELPAIQQAVVKQWLPEDTAAMLQTSECKRDYMWKRWHVQITPPGLTG